MKKIFLSFLAIIAMVGMVSAQRTWAYGLNMTQEGDNYTFVFKSTTAATAANLVFTDAAGEVAGKVALENVVAGENTKVLALADIPGEGTLNWAVELTGAAIEEVTQLTDDSKYGGFWFAYGVGVNNNPESDYFGNIYVSNPRHSSAPAQTGFYKYSPELVLDSTLFVDGTKVGYKPSNVTLANAVDAIQRMAVSPVDGTVAFVQWNAAPFAAYGMNPANLAGEAANLTEGINQPVALCYDYEGSLCVLSYDGKAEGVSVYALYIIKDGEITKFFSQAGWVAGGYCEIASDGQGGFYVMSGVLNSSNVVTAAKLQHISKNAEIDLTVLPGGAELAEAPATFNRLRLAYDLKHDVLAIGGGKKVNLYNATYAAETGAPTLTKWTATSELTTNIDGIAFDYAGDLYVVSAGTETFYKFALPTENNTCMTPAKKAQVIVKEVAPVVTLHKVLVGENLQAVVDQALSGDTVLVQAGTYEGNFTMKDGVFVSGGWNADFTAQTEHASILDAKANGRVLNQPANFETLTIWENFTIQNGKLTEIAADKLGSGVALMKKGRVINCLIQNNTFDYSGDCMGGGLGQETGDKNDTCAINCVVRNNKATHGGGVRIRGVILNSTMEYNESSNNGGGLYLQAGSAYNCIVTNNVSLAGGGGVDMYGSGSLVNCLIANNTAGNVGGLSMRSNNRETADNGSDIINCTVVNNTQKNTNNPQFCGVRLDVRNNPSRAFINNVVCGNTINGEAQAQELGGYPQGYGKFLNNAVAGTTANVTYIQLSAENDPQFNEDYSFATTSPLYNAGTNDALTYFVGDKDVYGNARKQGANIEIGAVEIAEPTQTVITETFDLTTEDTRNMMGTYNVYAGDYILRIYGYTGAGTYQDDPANEEDAAPLLFTPDYDDALNAVVVVTIDEENNKEVMQVTATSADGLKVYNLTINIALPNTVEHLVVPTDFTVEQVEPEPGLVVWNIEGTALMDTEDNVINFWAIVDPTAYMIEAEFGEVYAVGEAAIYDPFMGEISIESILKDEAGNTYNFSIVIPEFKQEVEITVAETVELTGYKLAFEMQGNMANVSAIVGDIELTFAMSLNSEDNGYGTYFNDAIWNVWYGNDANGFVALTPYGDEHVYSAENFKVSFINDPDEEGNVTLYNFTLIPGEKPATPTALDNIDATVAPMKMIENGQLIIMNGDVKFNSIGQKL